MRSDGGIHFEIQDLLVRQTQVIEGQNTILEELTSSFEFLSFVGNLTTYLRLIKTSK